MANKHGGKRSGAGRPTGSKSISDELRKAAQEHTGAALTALVEIVQDSAHPQRLKAAEVILCRGYGEAKSEPESKQIIMDFMSGEISAITCGLLLESQGLKVPELVQRYFDNEIRLKSYNDNHDPFDLNPKPEPLPLE